MAANRRLLVLASLVFCCTARAQAGVLRAVISFEGPAYANMPVWVHITLPQTKELSLAQANLRYPFSTQPWDFHGHDFLVTFNGEPLAKPPNTRFGGRGGGGSVAPQTSPQGRLPLHLHYRFDRPGRYLVRYQYYGFGPAGAGRPPIVSSDWTELEVNPSDESQRQDWLRDKVANPPRDPGLMIGDYLPSLLALPDEQVLHVLLARVHDENQLVQEFAVYGLYYYPEDVLRREIPRLIREQGPTTFLAYNLSWRRDIFRPVGEEIVTATIPYLGSDSPALVGGALQTLVFLRWPDWGLTKEIRARIDEAIWQAVDPILRFHESEVLAPLSSFLLMTKSERAHELLWRLTLEPQIREQALISLTGFADMEDLPKLGAILLTDGQSARFLPYHMRRAWGAAAIPYLLRGLRPSQDRYVQLACGEELALEHRPEAFAFFQEAMEGEDLRLKDGVVQFLVDRFGMKWGMSEAEVIAFIQAKIEETGRQKPG